MAMANCDEELSALRLFNEKAARLAASRFYASVLTGQNTPRMMSDTSTTPA